MNETKNQYLVHLNAADSGITQQRVIVDAVNELDARDMAQAYADDHQARLGTRINPKIADQIG